MRRTRNELMRVLREQKSMNRIEDRQLLEAIDRIKSDQARGYGEKLTMKNIVDTAYFSCDYRF